LAQSHITADEDLHQHNCENLKSDTIIDV